MTLEQTIAASRRLDRLLGEAGKGLSPMPIGGAFKASMLVTDIKTTVAKAMDEAKLQIAGAVTGLVEEIRGGTEDVVRTIEEEARKVRAEFGDIVGNAERAADDSVAAAKKLADNAAKTNGSN